MLPAIFDFLFRDLVVEATVSTRDSKNTRQAKLSFCGAILEYQRLFASRIATLRQSIRKGRKMNSSPARTVKTIAIHFSLRAWVVILVRLGHGQLQSNCSGVSDSSYRYRVTFREPTLSWPKRLLYTTFTNTKVREPFHGAGVHDKTISYDASRQKSPSTSKIDRPLHAKLKGCSSSAPQLLNIFKFRANFHPCTLAVKVRNFKLNFPKII